MKLEVTHIEPFNPNALGIYEIKGENMADREIQLWQLLEYNSTSKLNSISYNRVK
jgi:hypothetical protein